MENEIVNRDPEKNQEDKRNLNFVQVIINIIKNFLKIN
jgi:hypothetical protein